MNRNKLVESVLYNEEDTHKVIDSKFKVGDFVTGGQCDFGKVVRIYEAFGKERLMVKLVSGLISAVVPDGLKVITKDDVLKFINEE